jgi:hypothetical protein
MSEGKTYQMLWDCACGATGLLGVTHRHCPACGSPQDVTRRYYPDEAQKVAVEDHRFHGVDVVCGGCDTPNGAAAGFCSACGAPLDGSKSVATRATIGEGVDDSVAAAQAEDRARREAEQRARQAAAAAASGAPVPAERRFQRRNYAIALGVLIVGCGGLFALASWKKDVAVEVTGHAWERSIIVEAFKTVSESDWRDSVPADARGVTCRQERRGTTQVADGETCTTSRSDNGDGTYSENESCTTRYRDEPTYDDKCAYEVDRWVKIDTAVTRGASLSETPTWPTLSLVGQQREGKRDESYTVSFKGPEDAYSCELPEATWSTFALGSRWTSQAGVVTGALDCEALTPSR